MVTPTFDVVIILFSVEINKHAHWGDRYLSNFVLLSFFIALVIFL